MSKTPTLFDQNEPQAQAAEGAVKSMGTATNDTQDPISEGSRDATATHNAQDTASEQRSDATATHDSQDPTVEQSSDESDGEWAPGQPFEDFLYRIPLDEARVMTPAGHTAQQKRNKSRSGRTLLACRRWWT